MALLGPVPEVPPVGNTLPIPHIPQNTEYIKAGAVTFGVEHRVLSYEISTAYFRKALATRPDDLMRKVLVKVESEGKTNYPDDEGVSIHVFGERDGHLIEYLRFDCFDEQPHYHYVFPEPSAPTQRIMLDTAAEGDGMRWTMERLRTRLAPMLEHAHAVGLAKRVDRKAIEAALPKLQQAVERMLERLPARSAAS